MPVSPAPPADGASYFKLVQETRPSIRWLSNTLGDLVRIVGMIGVLMPAARLLPRRWALQLAAALALALILLPSPGMSAFRQMSKAFGRGTLASLRLSVEWLACPLRDYVVNQRIIFGLESPGDWKIREIGTEHVQHLREAGRPYIVATGHFTRRAWLAMHSAHVSPGTVLDVTAGLPEIRSVLDARVHVHFGSLLRATDQAWAHRSEFVWVGDNPAAGLMLLRKLSKGNVVALIHIDAPWPSNSPAAYTRAFAGKAAQTFSTGAVQLAKKAGCPIVPCVYALDDDGTVVIEWGAPVDAVDDPRAAMDHLLAMLENAIAHRPGQFVLEIGRDRRWNDVAKRWETLSG